MTIQTINIGYLANDGTGDDLREAFIKTNENFSYLEALVLNTVTFQIENLGTGKPIYRGKQGGNIHEFKTLIDGHGIALTENGNEITITGDPGIEDILLVTDNGSMNILGGHPWLYIWKGKNTVTRVEVPNSGPPTMHIDVKGEGLVELDPNPKLSGNLDGNNKQVYNLDFIQSSNIDGNLTGLVNGINLTDIDFMLRQFDFGSMSDSATGMLDFFSRYVDVDHQTFIDDNEVLMDMQYFRIV